MIENDNGDLMNLLFEIGTEELPSWYVLSAWRDVAELAKTLLANALHLIRFGSLLYPMCGTPPGAGAMRPLLPSK